VALANSLDLDERQALRMNAVMRTFDEKKEAIHEAMKQHFEVLEAAAGGEQRSEKTIDAAITGVMKAHAAMAAVQEEEFSALAKDLPPPKRARLAIFLRDFPKHVRRAMRMGRGGRGGSGRRGPGGGSGLPLEGFGLDRP